MQLYPKEMRGEMGWEWMLQQLNCKEAIKIKSLFLRDGKNVNLQEQILY